MQSSCFHFQYVVTRAEKPGASGLINKQDLFSVYVHAPPGYQFSSDNLFHGYEIAAPVDTGRAWGQFSLIQAEVRLIEEAVKDPLNRKFVLLSEACVPLHSPEVMYLQLMSELKSRLRGCMSLPLNPER